MIMKTNKKGFTLVELLAVIVILGIIMAVAGTAALKIRKNANIDTVKKLERTLRDIGPNLLSSEMSKSDSNFYAAYRALSNGENITMPTSDLYNAGYLKSSVIDNPSGADACYGFLRVKKTTSGPEFIAKICCPGLYETNKATLSDPTPDKCDDYIKSHLGYFD